MKAKYLLFSLLFLMLGTTAWADKYYQPGSYKGDVTPRLTLEQAVGKKFMIYNTAINGNEDRTGFLRNNGVNFELDKSKERDLYVYNESFVYTMEAYDDNADGVNDWYAIKSVLTGLYVNAAGRTDIGSATDAKLYISDWDNATGKSGVNMESWKYNVIANNKITSDGHGSTVFVVKNGNTYWNGDPIAFATYSDGHPFAFYIAHEVTSGDYLQDLHIYSRSDIYSAQVIYGYIKGASQITANPSFVGEGGFGDLIDGEATTYNVTNWNNNDSGHYYQIDLGESVESLYLYMQRRADGKNAPLEFELQACTTADGTYTKIGDYTTELASKAFYTSPKISLGGSYRHLRIVARETTTPNYTCMGLSELYVLPNTKELADVLGYINAVQSSPLFTKTTAKAYTALVEEYNTLYPDARLLSGVPIPGNKYRIYADTYDRTNQRYVNREIMAEGNGLEIEEPGTYHASTDDEKKKHEWYCEQTNDGKLVFRNVADPTKYLAYKELATTPYKWSINTVLTTHYGVPLLNEEMQYLAVTNDGHWQSDVESAQDQHQSYTYTVTDNKGTDDTSDDVTTTNTIEAGVCTDFLFIPVPLDETEKKITITAGELVERNTQLLYDGKVYPLPFSRMFKKTGDSWGNLPTLQLLCSNIHSYAGVKINNGETLVTVETTPKVTYNEATSTLSFNFDEIASGDVFDVQLEIKAPFKYSNPDMATEVQPTLYIIKNKRPQAVQQQTRPNRAAVDVDIEIGGDEEDGPISSQTGAYYYAKFDSRNSNMKLVQHDASFDAHSLFYFTQTEDTNTDEYYCARIHNVTTVMKCASDISWNTNGNTWYVQPNKTASYTGYNIATTILDATNNPSDTWCSNHADGDRILRYNANDDGSAWEFEEVSVAEAKTLLKKFIDSVADGLIAELGGITVEQAAAIGYDMAKIGQYKYIVEQLKSRAQGYHDAGNIAKLVQYAQNIHMIEHEIDYALYELPLLSDESKMDEAASFAHPHWYYVKNVNSKDRYATYSGDETPMTLGQKADGKLALPNLFYFVGEKNVYATDEYKDFPGNNLIIDEYLDIHIHNFMAKGKTLVAKNVELTKEAGITPGKGEQKVADVDLKGDEDWSLELEYDLDYDFQPYNAYGSCLLASANPLKDDYPNEFQVYLKDDRSLVIKVNNQYDTYRFWHTQDHFTHIKVVITYSQGNVTLDVYNSLGEKETKVVENTTLRDISSLYSALPEGGATISNLATYQVEAMTWKEHADASDKDEWYILPSSNLDEVGMAIVLGEPNDTKMAWTNNLGQNGTVSTDLGTNDNSTWKFERVTDFDAHVDELLGMYDFKDCVIYDRELAKLMGLIKEKETVIKAETNGAGEEAAFNEVYAAILSYTGRMPEHLMAPNPGVLYTIRPAVEEYTENALLVHTDWTNNTYTSKEIYLDDVINDEGEGNISYDSRSAWVFEGATGSTNTGLKVKNLHTQCYITALGADASAVNEADAATVTLKALGACTTMFQVGDKYMDRTTSTGPVIYTMDSGFWGSAITNYPAEVGTVFATVTQNGAVHCKSIPVYVAADGEVTVTFGHIDGDHKLNILGVTLTDGDGDVKASEYHYGKAGGSLVDNVYNLGTVVSGAYIVNCYVAELNDGDKDKLERAGGNIQFAGISQISGNSKLLNTGNENTKWIVEEIKNPETSIYYNVAKLSNSPSSNPDSRAYSTLYLGFDAKIPDGVSAWIVDKVYENNVLNMVEVEGGVVPANTGIILTSEEPMTNKKFYFSTVASTFNAEDNILSGTSYTKIEDCREKDIYMLSMKNNRIAMYWTYENRNAEGVKETFNGTTNHNESGYVMCNANKSYLEVSNGNAASSFGFLYDGNATDIYGVSDEMKGENGKVKVIYDLAGRRLVRVTSPGIYIVDGKKVYITEIED